MSRRRDVLYCEGPGNIVGAYRSWKSGVDHAAETSVTFSGQVFEFCRSEGLSLCAVSYGPGRDAEVDEEVDVRFLPRRVYRIPRIGYHVSLLVYAVRLLVLILRIRPRIVLITSGVVGWTFCSVLKFGGAPIVPILHNSLRPVTVPAAGIRERLREMVHRLLWPRLFPASMAVSPAVARQLRQILRGSPRPILEFRPSFPRRGFEDPSVPEKPASNPFRVLYAGRIEEDKGVFDLLSIARALKSEGPGRYHFSICGDGTALDELRRRIADLGLGDTMTCHGRLGRQDLIARYRESHVVIVPTRSSFCEGYAMVVAEAVLLLRPVLTSPAVPSAEVLKEAVLLATPDVVESYRTRLSELRASPPLYEHLIDEARRLRPVILDESTSFLAALGALKATLGIRGSEAQFSRRKL